MRLTDKQAHAAIAKWGEILKINPLYTYQVKVNNAPDPDVKRSERKGVQAEIKVDEAYYTLKITINAYEFDASQLDHVICHELLHVVLARISTLAEEVYGKEHQETAINLIESTTEQLAQAFMHFVPKPKPKPTRKPPGKKRR